ncbi:MAG: hypothetical protein SFU25_07680, partial [Candidatus Caenarcaniphilales bacterium]|nr:hypothetical protein [Candidatus Caenarcaniphilales bacterium]
HSLEEQSQASSWNKLPEKEANDLDSVVLTMLGTLFPVFRYSSSRLAKTSYFNLAKYCIRKRISKRSS